LTLLLRAITFASHTTAIHRCTIRYLILLHNKLKQQGALIGIVRPEIQGPLDTLHFAVRLWQIFRAIINGALLEMQSTLGKAVNEVMNKFDHRINELKQVDRGSLM
jgi:hypothetical protein